MHNVHSERKWDKQNRKMKINTKISRKRNENPHFIFLISHFDSLWRCQPSIGACVDAANYSQWVSTAQCRFRTICSDNYFHFFRLLLFFRSSSLFHSTNQAIFSLLCANRIKFNFRTTSLLRTTNYAEINTLHSHTRICIIVCVSNQRPINRFEPVRPDSFFMTSNFVQVLLFLRWWLATSTSDMCFSMICGGSRSLSRYFSVAFGSRWLSWWKSVMEEDKSMNQSKNWLFAGKTFDFSRLRLI